MNLQFGVTDFSVETEGSVIVEQSGLGVPFPSPWPPNNSVCLCCYLSKWRDQAQSSLGSCDCFLVSVSRSEARQLTSARAPLTLETVPVIYAEVSNMKFIAFVWALFLFICLFVFLVLFLEGNRIISRLDWAEGCWAFCVGTSGRTEGLEPILQSQGNKRNRETRLGFCTCSRVVVAPFNPRGSLWVQA